MYLTNSSVCVMDMNFFLVTAIYSSYCISIRSIFSVDVLKCFLLQHLLLYWCISAFIVLVLVFFVHHSKRSVGKKLHVFVSDGK